MTAPSTTNLQAEARAQLLAAGGIDRAPPADYLRIARLLAERGHGAEQVAHAMAAASCELMAIDRSAAGRIEPALCTAYMVALRQPERVHYLPLSTVHSIFQAATGAADDEQQKHPYPNATIH